MPVYLVRQDPDSPDVHEIEVPAVIDAANRAYLAWPTSAAAATAELAEHARDLAAADVTVHWHPDGLVLPDLPSAHGDTTGIRVRTTHRAPHALYVITANAVVPLTHAAGASEYLQPFIDAARGADGCCAETGEPCMRNCLPAPFAA